MAGSWGERWPSSEVWAKGGEGGVALAEEVIREYGYEHIAPTFLKAATVTTGGLTAEQKAQAKAKRTMCAQASTRPRRWLLRRR